MGGFVETTVLGILKAVVFFYDIIAFVPYFIIYKPSKTLKVSNRIKAKRVGSSPDDYYRSVDCFDRLTTTLFPECSTLDDLFVRAVRLHSSSPCLGTREVLEEQDEKQSNGRVFKKLILGDYTWLTYEECFLKATNLGSGLLAVGQKPRHNLVIFAETKAEWMISAQACFKYNFPLVTLYATLGVEAIIHGINETEATHVITTTCLLSKFQGNMDKMPKVTHIILMSEKAKVPHADKIPDRVTIMTMAEVEAIGSRPENITTPATKPKREDIAVIMYTSGSTGVPKGVMISHGNLMSGMSGQCQRIPQLGPPDVYIGYLPLAHVLELSAEFSCVAHGVRIGYSSPLTLTDQSSKIKKGTKGDVSILRPTLMASVPLIMDRISKGVWDKVNGSGPISRGLFTFAYQYKKKQLERGMDTPFLNKIVFPKIKDLLGGRIRLMLSGGAPLSGDTQRFMNICFCCPVGQGYGLTETCGAGTVAEVTDLSTGRVGAPLQCNEIRLRNWDEGNYLNTDKPFPRGEVLIGGGNITMGYYKSPEKTNEDFMVIKGTRYFCTGDIGQIDEDGSLRIIDRKKDLVKLQSGEYVSLGRIETVLKTSPLVDQVCVYGDSNHSHVVALVVPNQKNVTALAISQGMPDQDFNELCAVPALERMVHNQLAEVCRKAHLDRMEVPVRLHLCPEPWTPDAGLVTDAFKLKRRNIELTFRKELLRIYAQ